MELKAISAPDGRVGFSTLVSATALTENEQEEDVADEDSQDDQLVLCVQAELVRRRETIGDDYPFRIDANGRAMEFITPVTTTGSVYLFCLFLSQAFDRTIVSKALAPKTRPEIYSKHVPRWRPEDTFGGLPSHSAGRARMDLNS
jgi:hypothetical protein